MSKSAKKWDRSATNVTLQTILPTALVGRALPGSPARSRLSAALSRVAQTSHSIIAGAVTLLPPSPRYNSHRMRKTISVRLPEDLVEWLSDTAQKTGVPQSRIVREQLEKARASQKRPFLRLAGAVNGPRDLSRRKGFSRS
jgi:predicted transcriptional regulator